MRRVPHSSGRSGRAHHGIREVPAGGVPRSRVQDAPAPRPFLGPTPAYAGPAAYAVRPRVNGSALALVIVAGFSLFPFFLVTQAPALVLGIMALAQGGDPARSARLARRGWWAFAAGLASLLLLAVLAVAAVIGLISAIFS